jgi:CP family cyanate transporter-like MFS transporter
MGLLGLLLSKNMILLTTSVALIGVSGGACFSLAFTFIGLRSSNGAQAAELSGAAQSVGYLLAAAGPIIIGYLFDYTQTWASSIVLWLIITLLLLYAGLGAGRNRYIFPMDKPNNVLIKTSRG